MIDKTTALKKLFDGQVQLPPFKLRPMATQAWAGGRRVDWMVELIVSREDGVAVIQPDLLLDRLAANYEPPADLERILGGQFD